MREKAYKPQFYKHLSYNQFLDIIPKRRWDWAGERVLQLEKVKLYEHPEDYKDMMYSLAIPERNPIYPTFRAETGQWRHPSFDTLIPSATPAEVTTTTQRETGQLIILNFEGSDGSTTWTEEALGLTPYDVLNAEIDTDAIKHGGSSILLSGQGAPSYAAGTFKYSGYNVDGFNSNPLWTCHFWFCFGSADRDFAIQLRYYNGESIAPPSLDFYYLKISGSHYFKLVHDVGDSITDTDPNLLVVGDWYHIAIVSDVSSKVAYVHDTEGLLVKRLEIATADPTWDGQYPNHLYVINYWSSGAGNAWLDALEWVNYVKWTGNFTPPQNAPALGVVTV